MDRKGIAVFFIQLALFSTSHNASLANEKTNKPTVASKVKTHDKKIEEAQKTIETPFAVPEDVMKKMMDDVQRYNKLSPDEKQKEEIRREKIRIEARYEECNLGYNLFLKNNPTGNIKETTWYYCHNAYLEEKKNLEISK